VGGRYLNEGSKEETSAHGINIVVAAIDGQGIP
jgi:hypothetical protein